jgi:hypothetical protein
VIHGKNTHREQRSAPRRTQRLISLMGAALLLGALCAVCGCARYAPEPAPVPVRTIMEITLVTQEPVSPDFQYYIAMNITGSATETGPTEQLSGTDRAKNWTYYIVYDGQDMRFKENFITAPDDIDAIPTFFDESSPRYYSATASGNRIHLVVYLDALASTAKPRVWMNFVTSRYAIHDPEQDQIQAVDYLYPPYFYFQYGIVPQLISDANYAQISSYTPAEQGAAPANIVDWSISIYSR